MKTRELRIGDVAAQAGVNVQTLRYYERRGLLAEPERTVAGYRAYPPETVRLIRFIKRSQDLGFTLAEIEELIALRDASGRRRKSVRDLAAAKVRDIDKKIAQLQAMRGALSGLVVTCACDRAGPRCPILEALDDPPVASHSSVNTQTRGSPRVRAAGEPSRPSAR